MKKFRYPALAGLLVVLFFIVRPGATHRDQASPVPAPTIAAVAPPENFGAVPVNTAQVAPPTAQELPSERDKAKIFAKAKVLTERATPPGGDGRFTKRRLVEAEGKYPFLIVEEVWRKDAAGAEALIEEKTMVAIISWCGSGSRRSARRWRRSSRDLAARSGGRFRSRTSIW